MNTSLLTSVPIKRLISAAQSVSARYRALEKPYLRCEDDYIAYIGMRLPGTLAAISSVLKHIPDSSHIQTLLDLGAGPGTGYLAASQQFDGLTKATLIEADKQFIDIGKTLVTDKATWLHQSLPCEVEPHDLVLMSYSLGEMADPQTIVSLAWQSTQQYLVLIEPGTPTGYQLMIRMRDYLLTQGAHVVAPCPNALPCPINSPDWCHFPVRVERSKLHMQLKGGTLCYEDEKFSYIILSKQHTPLPEARIIAAPEHHKGHMTCRLCTRGELADIVVSKREGELYKKAKKLRWGDGFSAKVC